MIPKECLEMTVKEYRKWQKENIRCDKCKNYYGEESDSNCYFREGHFEPSDSCSPYFEAK
jgi:hypothetical protein